MTANETIRDRTLVHATYVQRFGGGLSRRSIELLRDVEADLIVQLQRRLAKIEQRGYDLGKTTTKRLESMLAGIQKTRAEGFKSFNAAVNVELVEFAAHEAGFQQLLIEGAVPIATTAPSKALLRSVVVARPFQGRVLRKWAGDLEAAELKALRQQIQIGMVEGESIPTITARVRSRLDQTSRQAEAIVRTAVNHTSNHARSEYSKANSDVIKSVQWLSTLDGRTSAICQSRDKKVFPVDSGPRPPAHFNCRSHMTDVVKSFRELGIDRDEFPAGTRSSLDGQVPADTTYGEWLRKQPNDFIRDTLGVKKGNLFIKGGIDVDRFVDRKGAELTLDQLKSRESAAWEKAFG